MQPPHCDDVRCYDGGDVIDADTGLRHGPFHADNARARVRYDQLLALGCSTIACGHGQL